MGGGPQPELTKGAATATPATEQTTGGLPTGVLPPVKVGVLKSGEKARENTGGSNPMGWNTTEIYTASVRLCSGIARNIKSSSSKLNKAEIADIACLTQEITSLFMALTLRLKDAEDRAIRAELTLSLDRAKQQQQQQQHANAVPARGPIATHSSGPSKATATFADILRMTGQASRPKPQQPAMTVAIYPAEGNDKVKTAEETKALLKASVNPQEIGVQVARLRKVGNGGVLLQTTSAESPEKLKKALPDTLRASEPKERAPLVAIINVEGDIQDNEAFKEDLIKQNFEEAERDSISKRMEVAFKKWRRGGAATTVVLRCSPTVRETLILKQGAAISGMGEVPLQGLCGRGLL
ncbi:hypothetical protein O0L34_g19156 [Tuta absoluta]|nr:hypothetical protein O0L34_g19156 [Tuta absoluta]